ncbi:uncharacterized protein C8Q71DRAFT_120542 [Rhodofomes roseus]|uniref:Uncharacterized protein n=1 Tax=Rhodofomes roseus TaxID=34475 RepID=A0ABQ8KCX5_9APHY|nr:uncharacterized protein C8Q71DRAFT_120542 [Rhodofomes roseus]KAH9835454.1 hypothetical protein C8Q71DRAFT_120542 [Rhodofomes roseus]
MRRSSVSSAGRAEPVADRLPPRPVEDRPPFSSRPRGDSYSEHKDRGPRAVCLPAAVFGELRGLIPPQSRFGPERAPPSSAPAPPNEPRIWMTREESEHFEMRHKDVKKAELTHKLPERPARTEPDSWRPTDGANSSTRFNGHNNARGDRDAVNDLPRPAAGEGSAGQRRQSDSRPADLPGGRKSPVEVRPRGRRPSLEGRLGPSYNDRHTTLAPPPASLPPRPIDREVHPELAPRSDYRSARDDANVREDEASTWDRSSIEPPRDVSPTNSATWIHPDRARLLQTAPLSSQSTGESTKTSKPVRIRRPPPMAKPPPEAMLAMADRLPLDEAADRMSDVRVDDNARPDLLRRTGSSLLDRLSLNDAPHAPEASSPSLRDRVDPYSKGPGAHGGDSLGEYAMDADMDGGSGEASRSKGGRKRSSRAKRGRRSGYPA